MVCIHCNVPIVEGSASPNVLGSWHMHEPEPGVQFWQCQRADGLSSCAEPKGD